MLAVALNLMQVIKLRIIPTSASNLRCVLERSMWCLGPEATVFDLLLACCLIGQCRRVKPEALVARVLPAEQLKRMKAGDVSGLLVSSRLLLNVDSAVDG